MEALEVVLWAARREMGNKEDLAPIAAKVRNWTEVVECASRSAVIPTVARALEGAAIVPFAIRRDLDRRYNAKAGHNAMLARELREILQDLADAGIPALAYKGPALALMAYGNLALRNPSSDIDLLLAPADIPRAKARMCGRGYRSILTPAQERHCLRHRYHLHFERSKPEIHLELHWAITPAYWPFPLDYWRRNRKIVIDGAEVRTLDPECTLLALCAHGCKEGWPRLSQMLDVSRLIQTHPELDWPWVLAEARRLKRERVLRLGLSLAAHWTRIPLPAAAAAFAAADPVVHELVPEIGKRMDTGTSLVGSGFHRYALRVWSRPGDRLRYLWYVLRMLPERLRTLAAAGDEDRKLIDLPVRLSFLYWLIRPLRALFQGGIDRVLWRLRRNL
jgi:hypothetical protein